MAGILTDALVLEALLRLAELARQVKVGGALLGVVNQVCPLLGEVSFPEGLRLAFLLAIVLPALAYLDQHLDQVEDSS